MLYSRIHCFYFILKGICTTGLYSLQVLFLWLVGRLNRAGVDEISRNWAQTLLYQADTTFNAEGLNNLKLEEGSCVIFMSNHNSMYDIPAAVAAVPGSIRMLAKKELSRYPILGQAMAAGEYLFIDRRNLRSALEDLEIAKAKLRSGIRLWIYPEGTRSLNSTPLPFKKGGFHVAVELKAKIIPVALIGTADVLSPTVWKLNRGRHITVRIGEAIDAGNFTKDSIDSLVAQTEKEVHSLLAQGHSHHAAKPLKIRKELQELSDNS